MDNVTKSLNEPFNCVEGLSYEDVIASDEYLEQNIIDEVTNCDTWNIVERVLNEQEKYIVKEYFVKN